jgi:hypothetical protein
MKAGGLNHMGGKWRAESHGREVEVDFVTVIIKHCGSYTS